MAEVVANGAEVELDLANRIPGSNEINVLLGQSSIGDQQVTMWRYDMGSLLPNDPTNGVIIPTLNTTGMGAHIRLSNLNVFPDWNQTDITQFSYILNKPTYSTVASTGAYSDLTGKPTIPSNTNQLTNGAGFISSVPAQSFSSLTSKPTTLSGYGITDSILLTTGSAASLTSFPTFNQSTTGNAATATKLAIARTINGVSFDGSANITVVDSTKFTIPTGSTSQYLRGDGSLATFPSIPTLPLADYTNTATTTSGTATFYLTNDKTSTGTALYTTVTYVNPVVNDVTANYVYSWTISGKTLTLTAKSAVPTGVIALLGISVLGAPTAVANGTTISLLVKGV